MMGFKNDSNQLKSKLRACTLCGFASSQEVCKACVLLEGLNKGLPKVAISKSSKVQKAFRTKDSNNVLQTHDDCGKGKNCCKIKNAKMNEISDKASISRNSNTQKNIYNMTKPSSLNEVLLDAKKDLDF